MKNYEFSLSFKLRNVAQPFEELVESLGHYGCTDALVGIGHAGCIGLQFNREASSAEEALFSAIGDVLKAIPGAELVEAMPDRVGLSEVAQVAGVTRQNLRKLMMTHAFEFPAPLHSGSTSLWHLADLADWLVNHNNYQFESTMLEIASVTKQVNLLTSLKDIEPGFQQKLNRFQEGAGHSIFLN